MKHPKRLSAIIFVLVMLLWLTGMIYLYLPNLFKYCDDLPCQRR
jgi:hypothetical protein